MLVNILCGIINVCNSLKIPNLSLDLHYCSKEDPWKDPWKDLRWTDYTFC